MNASVKVPLLDLNAQYNSIRAELDQALLKSVGTQHFILGPEVEALECEIAAYSRTPFAIGCASGSDALLLALMALNIKPGDEVICPSYTFFATAGAISRLGAITVFADISPVTYNVTADSIRAAADRCKRLKAIIPVHLYGQCAELEPIEKFARELQIPIVEDAAQAIGSDDPLGRRAGSVGALGALSFFPSKNLGCFGDGGMLTTGDATLADKLRVLRAHGSKPKYFHKVVGINSRLDAIQAAVLRVKLKYLDNWSAQRQRNAAFYDKCFAAAGAATSAMPLREGGLALRTPQPAASSARHIYNQYVIRVPAKLRDPLREHLKNRNIGTEVYYPLPLHLQECFANLGHGAGSLPESEAAAKETIALPIFPELNTAQMEHVVESVIGFLKKS